jgi:tetratricopeptide (TPR) repeat protein
VLGGEQRGADHAVVLDRNMTLGYARWTRANAWLRVGSYRRATADFEAAVLLSPSNAGVFNGFAWLMATCPDPLYRNGDYAVSYAQIATQLAPGNPAYQDTLAAALAATGQFAAARTAEQTAIKERGGSGDRADEYHHRARLYADGEPYLAARREEQIARDYCEQFSESPRATLQCPAP